MFECIRTIANSGITILLVEQNTRAALTVAQRGYVLSTGRVVYEGSAEDLARSEMVQKAFWAFTSGQAAGTAAANDGWLLPVEPQMLEIKGVSKRFGGLAAISGLSFELKRGEVLGVIGPNGAGKTTLLNVITGYSAPSEGAILLKGKRLNGLAPYDICRLGIARTFRWCGRSSKCHWRTM